MTAVLLPGPRPHPRDHPHPHARSRRAVLLAGVSTPLLFQRAFAAEPAGALDATLRQGGVVAVFRHAEAPGVYDPPNMALGDCSTQRNLDETGRAQSRRLGAWFESRRLLPARVLSSPWCRCLDTARLAFGSAQAWAALGSPAQTGSEARQAQVQALLQALRAVPAGRFEVWVTHNFVIADLTGLSTASAEGLVLRVGEKGGPSNGENSARTAQVLGRLGPA